MFFFFVFMGIVVFQRLLELIIARRNERWMKAHGAKEFGRNHYGLMVLLHVFFFVFLFAEVMIFKPAISPYWIPLLSVFFIAQLGRIWVISSLGKYWNTKIIVLPGAEIVAKGPFKYIKHPNYLIVTVDLAVIPLLFQAYWTALVFFILNQMILAIRIPAEEKALKENTDYDSHF